MNDMLKKLALMLMIMAVVVSCASKEEKKASHLQKGKAYFEKGEYKAAEIEFKNAIQIDPKDIAANLQLGETYMKIGDPQRAFRQYLNVMEIDPENIDASLKLAAFYMLAKDYQKSSEKIDLVLSKEPNNIEGLYLAAGVRDLQGDLNKAVDAYQRIVSIDGKQTRAYVGLANIALRQGNPREAESQLKKAIELDPKDPKAWSALITFYLSQKDYDQAEQEITRAIQANPDSAELYTLQGSFYSQQKRFESAEKSFAKAIELAPENVSPYVAMARFYGLTGKHEQAKEMYNKAMAIHPDDSALAISVARYLLSIKDTEASQSLVEKVINSRPNYLPALLMKGEILTSQRNWNDAIAIFDQIIAQDVKSAQAYYFKALCLVGKGDLQVAKATLAKALEIRPKDHRAKLLRAELSFKEQAYADAEKDCREVLQASPNQFQANLILGRALVGQGKLNEASAVFQGMTQQQPQNPQGYYQLGIVQRLQKNDSAALANFEKALALNPKLLDVLSQIVTIYAGRKDFAKALEICDRQLAAQKDSPFHQAFIHNMKGRLYAAQKMDHEAENAFQSAILAYPNLAQPYFGLAQIYLRRRETDKAIGQYNAMLEKNPDMVGPHMLLGTLYEALKNPDLSEKHYREVLRIDSGFAPAANNLAFMLAEKGENLDEALSLAQIAKEKLPEDPSVMDTLGWVYYKRGLYDSAISELAESMEKMPNNASIQFHLGMAYYKKGVTDKAKTYLQNSLNLDSKHPDADEAKEVLASMRS